MKRSSKRVIVRLIGSLAGLAIAKALDKDRTIGFAIGSAAGHILADELFDKK